MSSSTTAPRPLRLLGCLSVTGADARTFLQGQLSADVAALDAHGALLASCNSPQGRVQAVLWIVERGQEFALLLPASMVEQTALRLRKYVLRAKVTIDGAGHGLRVAISAAMPAGISLTGAQAHLEHEGTSYIRLPGHESILMLTGEPLPPADLEAEHAWRLANVRAGLPQVYPETHEAFVAQMLNLDLLGGISFEKGCYTGQEIIARAHFRGAVKRRMFRFSGAFAPPAPGARVLASELHAGEVVDAAAAGEGCEGLAVISLAQKDERLRIAGGDGVMKVLEQ